MKPSAQMDLTAFLRQIADTYDRAQGLQAPGQVLLKHAPSLLSEHCPAGFVVKGGGGKGTATLTPWVGFFNPDETLTPQEGIYVVYIMSADLEHVALSIQQGMEALRTQLGDKLARERLAADAGAIRSGLTAGRLEGFTDALDLQSSGARQKAYEAGSIACRMYRTKELPSEARLREDLSSMLYLYEEAILAKRRILLEDPGAIASPSTTHRSKSGDPLSGFHPKSDADYRATLVGRELVKSRRHEKLVADYGSWASTQGFVPATEHPQDLVLRKAGTTFLIEAKVLYGGNATEAVRAAVGQLLTYSYFLYDDPKPLLVGLFTERIGDAYVQFLSSLEISAVWWDGGIWRGSTAALNAGLASHGS